MQTYTEDSTLRGLVSSLAIAELTARYNHALDARDRGAWVDTFLPEGALELPTGQVCSGHAALGAYFADLPRDGVLVTTDPLISVDGVHARHECRFLVITSDPNHPQMTIKSLGRFRDHLVYERAAWYFSRRTVVMDLRPPA